jgi:hypothetical protein
MSALRHAFVYHLSILTVAHHPKKTVKSKSRDATTKQHNVLKDKDDRHAYEHRNAGWTPRTTVFGCQ